ncbi:MAG: MotA/TolQ/ExbB proton channel family protein [Rhodospirillaceae bacterium]|nr:MAG: MotA/TolQ/ExbB proton channel family protein [Rhodospirillaceae bacterium]
MLGALSITGNDVTAVFDNLKQGLEKPLSGMGTAFSSSLLGLSGSLVIGFLDLQSGQAQNDFYKGLEDWLASQARLSGSGGADAEQPLPAYMQALLEQAADSVSELARIVARSQESQATLTAALRTFADRVTVLTDQMRVQHGLLERLASHQMALQPAMEHLARIQEREEINQMHLRNLDNAVGRLAEDSVTGRERLIKEIRSEIRFLARTIAVLAEDAERQA